MPLLTLLRRLRRRAIFYHKKNGNKEDRCQYHEAADDDGLEECAGKIKNRRNEMSPCHYPLVHQRSPARTARGDWLPGADDDPNNPREAG